MLSVPIPLMEGNSVIWLMQKQEQHELFQSPGGTAFAAKQQHKETVHILSNGFHVAVSFRISEAILGRVESSGVNSLNPDLVGREVSILFGLLDAEAKVNHIDRSPALVHAL